MTLTDSIASRRVVLTLPSPPSVNELHANRKGGRGKGRYPTKRYIAWQQDAGWELRIQKPRPIKGPYNILFELGKERGDLQNRIKATSDLLVKHGIVEDDSLEREVTMRWADIEGCRVTLTAADKG